MCWHFVFLAVFDYILNAFVCVLKSIKKFQDVLSVFPMDVAKVLVSREEIVIQVMFFVRKLSPVIHCCTQLVGIRSGFRTIFLRTVHS